MALSTWCSTKSWALRLHHVDFVCRVQIYSTQNVVREASVSRNEIKYVYMKVNWYRLANKWHSIEKGRIFHPASEWHECHLFIANWLLKHRGRFLWELIHYYILILIQHFHFFSLASRR